ncbi:MAG: T9SS type A sorting domain-containing protein [Polaribacter sp.]|uniref:T9SS type A sorting domain-containing protein n=1 Tax=Polaribacter sp. TaxID=1920175 RepID=UPI00326453A6
MPTQIHPDGTLIPSDPFVFVVRNVPQEQSNVVTLRFYPYPDGVDMNAYSHGWESGSDNISMTLSSLNDTDINNGFFKTETVNNEDGTFTKTYSVFNVSKDITLTSTAKNGGLVDGVSYAPVVRIIQANGQILDSTGEMGIGNNPLEVDQASLDRSPDYLKTSFGFSYYPPEENATTGGGEHPHVTATTLIDLFSDDESSKQNQIISFENQVIKKYSNNPPFTISATSTSGLTNIDYSVVSGPATISGNKVTLNGSSGGLVIIKAFQSGDSNYNASENYMQFQVIDLGEYTPVISTRLTSDYPIEMPSLYAYPIYLTAEIDEPNLIHIENVEVKINDEALETFGDKGTYYVLWEPGSYGLHNVVITANASNGQSTTITKEIEVTNENIASQNVSTMDEVLIEYGVTGQWHYGTYTMPQHVGSYNKIIANMLVECPSSTGDCDDWDRLAYIDVMGPDGNWIQIIRYATPFGVGCNHSIDLTDYASLLQGEVQLRMYIATFGTGGWQISLDLSYEEGTPEYLYSTVDELWDGAWEFGDPTNLDPVPTKNYTYDSNVLKSHLRLSTTGHGWGENNSQNAAEFYQAVHYIDIDGSVNSLHSVWNICSPNPDNCIGQVGSWVYNRSGWCPGAISPPHIVNMTSKIAKGNVDFGYRFDPRYVDYCHPNNPDCISGVTCANCNDTFIARYVVDGQLINFSNTPLIEGTLNIEEVNNTANYKLIAHPNPSNGLFKIYTSSTFSKSVVHVISVSGEIIKSYSINSSEQLNNTTFNLSTLAKGLYFVTIENNSGNGTLKLIIN